MSHGQSLNVQLGWSFKDVDEQPYEHVHLSTCVVASLTIQSSLCPKSSLPAWCHSALFRVDTRSSINKKDKGHTLPRQVICCSRKLETHPRQLFVLCNLSPSLGSTALVATLLSVYSLVIPLTPRTLLCSLDIKTEESGHGSNKQIHPSIHPYPNLPSLHFDLPFPVSSHQFFLARSRSTNNNKQQPIDVYPTSTFTFS